MQILTIFKANQKYCVISDIILHLIILLPLQVITCDSHPKPAGLIWSMISQRKFERILCLSKLKETEEAAGKDVTLKVTNEDDKGV